MYVVVNLRQLLNFINDQFTKLLNNSSFKKKMMIDFLQLFLEKNSPFLRILVHIMNC